MKKSICVRLLFQMLLLETMASGSYFSTPLLGLEMVPDNGSNTTAFNNKFVHTLFHFHGKAGSEDTFQYTIVVFYNNQTSNMDKGRIASNKGISIFNPDLLYEKSYWTNSGHNDMKFEVRVSNFEKHEVERVRVELEYTYNRQSERKRFMLDVWFEHTSELADTEATKSGDRGTVQPAVATPPMHAETKSSNTVVLAVGICLGTVCFILFVLLLSALLYMCKRPPPAAHSRTQSSEPEANESLPSGYTTPTRNNSSHSNSTPISVNDSRHNFLPPPND